MPGRNQYPSGADLQAFLEAGGFADTITTDATFLGADLELYALAGWEEFNGRANRRMLAIPGTRSFDRASAANGVLVFGEDLASGPAVTASDGGTALTANTDYRLEPLNAPGLGVPYNRARFSVWRRWGYPLYSVAPPLAITGSWGYAATIPEDAFVGMLCLAALSLFPLIQQARTSGMLAWQEADMHEQYGPNPLMGLKLGWEGRAMATCGGWNEQGKFVYGRYTRPAFGAGSGWMR